MKVCVRVCVCLCVFMCVCVCVGTMRQRTVLWLLPDAGSINSLLHPSTPPPPSPPPPPPRGYLLLWLRLSGERVADASLRALGVMADARDAGDRSIAATEQ